jgi:hypothetical protein
MVCTQRMESEEKESVLSRCEPIVHGLSDFSRAITITSKILLMFQVVRKGCLLRNVKGTFIGMSEVFLSMDPPTFLSAQKPNPRCTLHKLSSKANPDALLGKRPFYHTPRSLAAVAGSRGGTRGVGTRTRASSFKVFSVMLAKLALGGP